VGILNWGRRQRKHEDEGMEAWRQMQPGESRREYLKRYQRNYHKEHWYPDHRQERIKQTIDRRVDLKAWYNNYKKTLSCVRCGYDRPSGLQFHHRDPKHKAFNVSSFIRNGVALETLQAEIAKCDVLCANCHAEVEQEERDRRGGKRRG